MTRIGKALLLPFWVAFRIIGIIMALPLILMALRNNPEYEYDENADED